VHPNSWSHYRNGSAAYREFWAKLNRGEYQAAEYKRIGKGGKEVWIQATYNPIFDEQGKVFREDDAKSGESVRPSGWRQAARDGTVDSGRGEGGCAISFVKGGAQGSAENSSRS